MRAKLLFVLIVCGLLAMLAARSFTQTAPPTLRAIFFNNTAHVELQPELPLAIAGDQSVAGHPWYESRIFGPPGAPLNLNPHIQVVTGLEPSRFFRPPGRIIPSPFNTGTFQSDPASGGGFTYTAQYPQIFTPRDGRNTVVLALVDKGNSVLFNTNFDLFYDVDPTVIEGPSGTQHVTIELTPRLPNLAVIIRLRVESTDQVNVQLVSGAATPVPSSSTPESVIWSLSNPTVDETLTFTAQVSAQNLASPANVFHVADLLITSSGPVQVLGTTGPATSVQFPSASLPPALQSVTYSVSSPAFWRFETANRTLVDIRETTELQP